MAHHKHGEMEINEQERTFEGFIKWSTYVAVASICILIFMAVFNG